jgi:hypothetical protein
MPFHRMLRAPGVAHLAINIDDDAVTTLCGRTVLNEPWGDLSSLRGDECQQCQAKTFHVKSASGAIDPANGSFPDAVLKKRLGDDGVTLEKRLPTKRSRLGGPIPRIRSDRPPRVGSNSPAFPWPSTDITAGRGKSLKGKCRLGVVTNRQNIPLRRSRRS